MKHATNSPLFALFWHTSGGHSLPGGEYARSGAGGVTPQNTRREQKVTFLDAHKFRKAEKSPIAKKHSYMRLCDFVQVWMHEIFLRNKKDQKHDSLAFILRAL
jgi:hypothetical protein